MARQRLDTKQAAEALGISMDAVRKRASRGQIQSEKDADGKLYIWLDTDTSGQDRDPRDLLIEFLRDQLERAEARDRENRRLLAAALERIPAIEAPPDPPPEPRESPVTATEPRSDNQVPQEEEKPSWWRRWFGT